jgi:hypothetical protein
MKGDFTLAPGDCPSNVTSPLLTSHLTSPHLTNAAAAVEADHVAQGQAAAGHLFGSGVSTPLYFWVSRLRVAYPMRQASTAGRAVWLQVGLGLCEGPRGLCAIGRLKRRQVCPRTAKLYPWRLHTTLR